MTTKEYRFAVFSITPHDEAFATTGDIVSVTTVDEALAFLCSLP